MTRNDDQRPQHAAAEDLAVEQQRDAETEQQRKQHRHQRQNHGVDKRGAEDRVREDEGVVVQPGEMAGERMVQVVGLQAVPDGQHERDLRDDDGEHQRGQQRYPAAPVAPAVPHPCRFRGNVTAAVGENCHDCPLAAAHATHVLLAGSQAGRSRRGGISRLPVPSRRSSSACAPHL
jgi:hypothetical protein